MPSVPEIRLHKATPTSGLWRLAEIDGEASAPPYWSSWWGGGIALARHVLDHPNIVAGQRVLDIGAGSGLVAIAAAKSGACDVLAIDIDPIAVTAIELNAAANGVAVGAHCGDLRADDPPDVDIVLAGDIFYAPDLAAHALTYLDRCRARGMRVLVGDPGRAHLPRARLRFIAAYEGADFAAPRAQVSVYALA